MRAIRIALLAFALATGLPASGQAATPFETAALSIIEPCFKITPSAETAASAVTVCEQAIADVATLRSQHPSLAGHDLNAFLIVTSMAETRVGNSYAVQDSNMRTARVCVRMERSWAAVAQLDPSASPNYASTMATLRESAVNVVRKCRSENGTPAGGPPLPG